MNTIWVFGDQLNRNIGALAEADPSNDRILLVESDSMLRRRVYHRQRLHLVIAAMRNFSDELSDAGFEVDYRRGQTLESGLRAHCRAHRPKAVVATEPNNRNVEGLVRRLGVSTIRSNQFICHRDAFKEWAETTNSPRMENFYRLQRRAHDYLMDGDKPCGGRWNHDHDNRTPPPKDGGDWPRPPRSALREVDRDIIEALPQSAIGAAPTGVWATSRRAALARLHHFVKKALPGFGPYEDAMLSENWHLAHSMLSPYLNIGLLLPQEVCDSIESAYRDGDVPINSAEGMIRQVLGWREYMWGMYWFKPKLVHSNRLDHRRALPPSWAGESDSSLNCLRIVLKDLDERGYVHHIQRLMVLANFANLYGIHPTRVLQWMRERYIDGADWVMAPNVMGMGLWADGGTLSTKPYVSGGAYLNRMSDYCGDCRFNPAQRTGEDACPFTTLYWDFLHRHRSKLENNPRMAQQYSTLDRLKDKAETLSRAEKVIRLIRAGSI